MEENKEYDEKVRNLESIFGPQGNSVLHASIPFFVGQDNGGASDVFIFPEHQKGFAYSTFDLIGCEDQIQNKIGNYELAICHKTDLDWGPELISQLAYYTLEEEVNSGETMGVGSWSEGDITSLLFHEYGVFSFHETKCGVLLCVGITDSELEFAEENGSDGLIQALKENEIYPFTIFDRPSVVRA